MKRTATPDSPALFDLVDTGPDFAFELEAKKKGLWPVAGTDEAGRGHLPARWLRRPSFSIRIIFPKAWTIPRS